VCASPVDIPLICTCRQGPEKLQAELPGKVEHVVRLQLPPARVALYRKYLASIMKKVRPAHVL
jgi:hypothetical protein